MTVKQQQRRAARPLAGRIGARRRPGRPRGASPDRQESGWPDVAGLDQQQTMLLAVLHRAGGEVVSYDELRDAGIEYPASVVAELELSEFPLERSFGGAPGRKLGVRLDQRATTPADPPEDGDEATRTLAPRRVAGRRAGVGLASAAATIARRASLAGASYAASTANTARAVARSAIARASASRARAVAQSPSLGVNARWVAPALLVLVIGIAVALIAAGTGRTGRVTTEYRGSAPPSRGSRAAGAPAGSVAPATHAPPASTTQAAAPKSQAPAATSTPPAPPAQVPPSSATPPTPVSVASAAQLESRGHALLAAGQAQSAIPTLRQALAATGKDPAACVEPASEACLTYAYALYDLGRALRVAGEPAAAVPILEQRLTIANQRPTVQEELQRARQEAGKGPTTASPRPSRPTARKPTAR